MRSWGIAALVGIVALAAGVEVKADEFTRIQTGETYKFQKLETVFDDVRYQLVWYGVADEKRLDPRLVFASDYPDFRDMFVILDFEGGHLCATNSVDSLLVRFRTAYRDKGDPRGNGPVQLSTWYVTDSNEDLIFYGEKHTYQGRSTLHTTKELLENVFTREKLYIEVTDDCGETRRLDFEFKGNDLPETRKILDLDLL